MDTGKVELSKKYQDKINHLHHDKINNNRDKIKYFGNLDIDDHGFIYFPDFHFTPITNQDGKVYGMKLLGENFRKILNEMPVYINENSSLATCWPGNLSTWMDIGFRPEHEPVHLYPIHEKYGIWQHGCGGMNHLCPDLRIGLELGWSGLLANVRKYREFHEPTDTSFYDGEELLIMGVLEWINRHVEYAMKLAETASSEEEKQNYLEIAEVNQHLLTRAPANFREACQFLAHFQCIDRMYCAGGAIGQLDELLRPFYITDVKEKKLNDQEVIWHLASLLFNDTHYSQIGGLSPDGKKDMTSRMSFLILDATHYLKIPSNLSIRLHDNLNKDLLERSLEYNMLDGTGASYSCNIGCEEGFVKNGFPVELARMRVKSGCNWTAIPGEEYPLQDVTRINMATALEMALAEMKESQYRSLDILWELFTKHLSVMIDCIKDGYDWHYEHVSEDTPEIVLNLFMRGPIERGLNCASGGVDILNFNIDGIGLATVADSFGAIEQRIEKEQRLSFDQLFQVLDADYEGYEDVRLMLKNIKRLGNPESPSMAFAERIRDFFVSCCRDTPTKKYGLPIIPGMFSHGDIVRYGHTLKATPNGRKGGEPISHSNEPDPGFADALYSFSPTLKATTVAKLQPGYGNSSPLHLDIDSSMLNKEGGMEALISLLHTHNHMGGTLIHLNCLTKERLLKAHKDPDSDPDLVIRVTGYSAFFSSLSKEYRQQIVDRFLA